MDSHSVPERLAKLEENQGKIKAILNIVIDHLPNGSEIRAQIEDDQSSAGFLE